MISESLARRYSVALFNLACDRDILAQVSEEFKLIHDLLKNMDNFRHFLFSPKVDAARKKGILKSVFGEKLSHTMLYFLYLLIDKKRQTLIMKMHSHFVTLYNNYYRRAEITIRPAAALDKEIHDEIKRVFEKMLDKTVTVREKVDKSLIGGFQIQVNNTVYDASLAAKLRAIRQVLTV